MPLSTEQSEELIKAGHAIHVGLSVSILGGMAGFFLGGKDHRVAGTVAGVLLGGLLTPVVQVALPEEK